MSALVSPGFTDWFAMNWGNVASVIGAILTIYFSRAAKSAADSAKLAAADARTRMQMVDWVVIFSEMVAQIEELLSRLGANPDWNLVSRSCTKLRASAAICSTDHSPVRDEELIRKVKMSATQFASIAGLADKFAENGEQVSLVKIKKTLADQRELYTVVLNEAKQLATRTSHGQ